jgi:hypothetical protein
MSQKPNTAEPQKPRRPWFQFRLRTLFITVPWIGIVFGVWTRFGPPWVVEVYDWRRDRPTRSGDGVFPTLVELVAFLVFMDIWRRWHGRTRKASRGEVVATVCLAAIVAVVVWAVLNVGSVIGDRNLLRR